jgi:hypothetical protein
MNSNLFPDGKLASQAAQDSDYGKYLQISTFTLTDRTQGFLTRASP